MAHSMGELKARAVFLGMPSLKDMRALARQIEAEKFDLNAMNVHTDAYVALLRELREEAGGEDAIVLLEQRVNTGVPLCWGTSDAVIVGPEKLIIVDLKYGQGVPVDAYENPQLMLYGVGALETIADMLSEVKDVAVVVFQPRLNSTSRFDIPAVDLRAWRDSLLPVAEEALHSPTPSFGPSESACRWCPLAGQCRAQTEWATARDFGRHPDLLSPEEIGEQLEDAPRIAKWLEALRAAALKMAYEDDTPIPGWKVVRSAGRRSIKDPMHAIQHAIDEGWNAEDVATFKLKTLGELEKALGGATEFNRVFADFIEKSEGSPSMVRESDKRPAINMLGEAKKDFGSVPPEGDASA